MKFLCVPCDTPMTLQSVDPPERGSLAVVYACPACGYEMAMLTNAYETQLVQSLGVRIGPAGASSSGAVPSSETFSSQVVGPRAAASPTPVAAASAATGAMAATTTSTATTATIVAAAAAAKAASAGGCPFVGMIPAAEGVPNGEPVAVAVPVTWTAAAEARLANIPAFVRPMARTGIERFARERGASQVDEPLLDAAREFFGM
jgi:hypothetical protein